MKANNYLMIAALAICAAGCSKPAEEPVKAPQVAATTVGDGNSVKLTIKIPEALKGKFSSATPGSQVKLSADEAQQLLDSYAKSEDAKECTVFTVCVPDGSGGWDCQSECL